MPPVLLSTSSVFPEPVQGAFEIAATLGYDGLEVMVFTDPLTQDAVALSRMVEEFGLPVKSVHAPCLLVTQRVWGRDPWVKVERSVELAGELGASVVVLHPAFRWQREYARNFVDRVNQLSIESGIAIAVENMFPWFFGGREVQGYLPHPQQSGLGYRHTTLDLSHTSTSGLDALTLARELGETLTHIHLADGLGSKRDEHLPPGTGNQPCAQLLQQVTQFPHVQSIAAEVNTRYAENRDQRIKTLKETLHFARTYLGQ